MELAARTASVVTFRHKTDVEITFVDNGDARTRVEIEHRGWDRLGADGPGWREANRGAGPPCSRAT